MLLKLPKDGTQLNGFWRSFSSQKIAKLPSEIENSPTYFKQDQLDEDWHNSLKPGIAWQSQWSSEARRSTSGHCSTRRNMAELLDVE